LLNKCVRKQFKFLSLGIKKNVSETEIKAVYQNLSQKWHPDGFSNRKKIKYCPKNCGSSKANAK